MRKMQLAEEERLAAAERKKREQERRLAGSQGKGQKKSPRKSIK